MPRVTNARSSAFADKAARVKYAEAVRSLVFGLLDECELPRDALPYTEEFDRLKARFERKQKTTMTELDFWRMLSSIGKGGGLGNKGGKKKAPRTPTLTDDEQLEILRLMPDGIGNRDELPYTGKFEVMHRRFTKLTEKKLSKHEFGAACPAWRSFPASLSRYTKQRRLAASRRTWLRFLSETTRGGARSR